MIVKTFTIGNTKITINDASCVQSREEIEQILRNVGRIVFDSEKRRVQNAK